MSDCLLPATDWTDFYDFTMSGVFLEEFPEAEGRFELFNRGETQFKAGFGKRLRFQTDAAADLRPSHGLDRFLVKKVGFLKPADLQWLMSYRFDPKEVSIKQNGGDIQWSAEGPFARASLWEVPSMALTSWLHFEGIEPDPNWENRLREKAQRLKDAGVRWVDFGTRRSFSREVHERVVEILKEYSIDETGAGFISTSCVYLDNKHNLTPSGTMGHKLIMANAGIYGVQSANSMMMKQWQDKYQGNLGTVLPDTYTTEAFLRDFGPMYARLFDSIRQDSGDPFSFADTIIKHYESLKIDPKSKTIIFSDSLNVDTVIKLAQHCKGKIQCSFGIGTNLTNDVGVKPLNIVIKLVKVRKSKRHPWVEVCKLSDTPGKITGSSNAAVIAKRLLALS